MILAHLEGAKTLVLINFSSAFNCIQPHFLAVRKPVLGTKVVVHTDIFSSVNLSLFSHLCVSIGDLM